MVRPFFGVSTGMACLCSISLIHVLLHVLQTTFAVQSNSLATFSHLFPRPSTYFIRPFPENSLFIHLPKMCSADRFAVSGQNAQLLITGLPSKHFQTLP